MPFTYANIESDIQTKLQNHFQSVTNPRRAINNAMRELFLQ